MPRGKHRETLIDAGIELIQSDGFEATGVQQIANAAQVPKGSFYNYFESKDDFGLEVAATYAERAYPELRDALLEGPGTPLERLEALFVAWTEHFAVDGCTRGCLAGQLCQEMAGRSEAFQGALESIFVRYETIFAECLGAAREVGELPPDADVDALAAFVYNSWHGALLRMKAAKSVAPLELCRRMLFEQVLVAG